MCQTVTWTYVTAAQTDITAGQRIAPVAAGVVLPLSAVTAVLHGFASVFGDDMHAYLLTGQRQSSDDIWPQVRTLTLC